MTISVGMICKPVKEISGGDLYREADTLLYQAKIKAATKLYLKSLINTTQTIEL